MRVLSHGGHDAVHTKTSASFLKASWPSPFDLAALAPDNAVTGEVKSCQHHNDVPVMRLTRQVLTVRWLCYKLPLGSSQRIGNSTGQSHTHASNCSLRITRDYSCSHLCDDSPLARRGAKERGSKGSKGSTGIDAGTLDCKLRPAFFGYGAYCTGYESRHSHRQRHWHKCKIRRRCGDCSLDRIQRATTPSLDEVSVYPRHRQSAAADSMAPHSLGVHERWI